MGKKSRARAARQLEKANLDAKLAQKKKEQRKTTKTVLVSVCSFLLVIALVLGVTAAVTESGVLLRSAVSLSTEHIKVDNAMLSYFFYNEFYNHLSENSSAAKNLTSSLSLKQQSYSGDVTWFDYIMGHALSDLATYVMLAEAAKVEGLTLDEEDYAQIDAAIANLETQAKEAGVSTKKYISASYGKGVKESDLRRAIEIMLLAEKMNEKVVDSISFTSDEKADYFEKNKNSFTYVSYKSFKMSVEDYYGEENVPEDAELTVSTMATMLGASRSQEEFDQKVRNYLTEAYANKGEELTDEELERLVAATVVTDAANYSDAFSTWAYDEARAVGDTTMISEGGTHTAYLLTETAHKFDYTTKNIMQILVTASNNENDENAKKVADDILASWKAGEATAESFEALAKEKNEGLSISYENLTKNTGLAEFDEWIYDEARKPGDAEVVKTYYGYHVMYFVGDGDEAWETEVEASMTNDKYQEIMEEYEKTYVITYNEKKYNGVSGDFPTL